MCVLPDENADARQGASHTGVPSTTRRRACFFCVGEAWASERISLTSRVFPFMPNGAMRSPWMGCLQIQRPEVARLHPSHRKEFCQLQIV